MWKDLVWPQIRYNMFLKFEHMQFWGSCLNMKSMFKWLPNVTLCHSAGAMANTCMWSLIYAEHGFYWFLVEIWSEALLCLWTGKPLTGLRLPSSYKRSNTVTLSSAGQTNSKHFKEAFSVKQFQKPWNKGIPAYSR